ncbi:zinc carboxypeptidase [Aureibaculum sp. A20]|uniref:Zinc carboxypeptidase n=1 Tax=Aureibaculum flavum TaxID=2795986 RepID=A0ABS0WV15_9FLAO|nr:M14 family metallopeptidase [Aureibaculum flavum]MBJ2175828.1 zinc carboxypeptidase [Aureibaculum flavum]
MKKIVLFGVLFLISVTTFSQSKSPNEFLGYELGDRFTRHHQVVDYFTHIAIENDNVKLIKYGETYENRALELAFITAPKNFSKLESIRTNHLKSIGILNGESNSDLSIVWLSYNVHGNEAVSTEAAMKTLYALIDPNNAETKKWLENTIVIIDPCINPDGRDRYVNWYNQYQNKPYNVNPDSKEHHEPWPGGRANHYLFDLNRDWAWASQTETQSRLIEYNKWMPHVHVDFHEQGVNNPYYFAPAAEPYHEIITDFQREFQAEIGKNHAKYFDKNGWLYFTKEVFDLLYPSYGDTYPMYNGAIGMTYEQGGSGRAGLGIITAEDDVLTLKDRIAHHYTTGLSTIEMASLNANKLQQEFVTYFKNARNNPKGKYKSYVVSSNNSKDKINSLKKLLDRHQIKYGWSTASNSVKAYDYQSNKTRSVKISSRDIVINTNQPKSNFINALFEPQTKIVDSLTYDITAWALPYSRGLETYALSNPLATESVPEDAKGASPLGVENPYAYLAKWNSTVDASFLSYLLQHKVKVRFSQSPFTVEGEDYDAGTLIITRRGNEKLGEKFDAIVKEATRKFDRVITGVATGLVTKGKDFGSSSVSYLKAPKIAVLSGSGVSSLGFGEVWHFFEQQIKYPVTVLDTDYFGRVNLDKYDVLVLPSGSYASVLSKDKLGEVKKWVQKGGRLVAIDRALNTFADSDEFSLSNFKDEDEKKDKEKEKKAWKENLILEKYDNLERQSLSNIITGSIFKATMDNTNPLGFGYGINYHTLRLNSNHFAYLNDGVNVSVINSEKDIVSGFAGVNALKNIEKSLVFGVEEKGRGAVIYLADNPLFRSFWENGKLVFCNAIFMVGQ